MWKTSDVIDSIRSTVGSNSIIVTILIYTLLPDGMYPILCDTKSENEFVQQISTNIQKSNSINDNEES